MEKYNMTVELSTDKLSKVKHIIESKGVDIVFFCLDECNEDELMLIKDAKEKGSNVKYIILDFNSNKEVFIQAVKYGVEGYILGSSEEKEIIHIIKEVYRGKKYYDACLVDSMVNEQYVKPDFIIKLTPREKEILCTIGKGMSNREISKELYISENTVKKHINHIFEKLELYDRTQVALYANKYGIVG